MLICTCASLEDVFRSYSRLWIRQRPSQANVRSTTQRHLITRNPSLPGGRLLTSITYQPCLETHPSSYGCGTCCPPRASPGGGTTPWVSFASTCGAAVPSSAAALVTVTAKSSPSVSTTMCRFRPLSRLPPS